MDKTIYQQTHCSHCETRNEKFASLAKNHTFAYTACFLIIASLRDHHARKFTDTTTSVFRTWLFCKTFPLRPGSIGPATKTKTPIRIPVSVADAFDSLCLLETCMVQ